MKETFAIEAQAGWTWVCAICKRPLREAGPAPRYCHRCYHGYPKEKTP